MVPVLVLLVMLVTGMPDGALISSTAENAETQGCFWHGYANVLLCIRVS